jgi:acyl-[acyl-carrier-protein]-phospholipid O-acyltransferase/long-chain-fatty-acid--[acyl-carrier-protein] ligase
MVPHMAVEEEYLRALGEPGSVLAVTSIPDDRRGERLIVFHTDAAGDAASLHAILTASSIPNLWKPDRDAYRRIESIPMTGTGKLDIRHLRRLAEQETQIEKPDSGI